MDAPDVQVYLTELGDSSVNFEIRYWTKPDIASGAQRPGQGDLGGQAGFDEVGFLDPVGIRTPKFDTSLQMAGELSPSALSANRPG